MGREREELNLLDNENGIVVLNRFMRERSKLIRGMN